MPLFMIAAAQLAAAEPAYDVTIRSNGNGEPATVQISAVIPGDADGQTVLVLPDSWGGEDELWRAIADLSVSGGVLEATDRDAPARRTVRHQPGAALNVTWRVVQDREGEPTAASDDNYRPWVRPDYVHLLGQTIFVTPQDAPAGLVQVTFQTPQGWALASDLEGGADSFADLRQSVIAAGDFRIATLDIAGERVAVRGDLDDALIIAATEAAARGNLIYWEEELMDWADSYFAQAGSPYLVTALPLIAEPGRSSFGGTNLYDAFALFGTTDTPPDILQRILVHEHAHSWIPSRVGGLPDGEDEAAGYWFSEGFTDFVTTRAGLLGGAWNIEEAISQWNGFLDEYMSSPRRAAPNTAIRDGFWTDFHLQRLPYLRGNLFAARIDHEIRTVTEGRYDLDDVLYAMRADPPAPSAPEAFVDQVLAVTGVDIAELHQRYIVQGETLIMPAGTFGACGTVETGVAPVFVYGMTLTENPEGSGFVIETVDPDGPAAGVFEPGMILLERVAGAVGDATRESAFRVRHDGAEKVLSYLPTSGEMAEYQRLVTAAGAGDDMDCFAALAGKRID